MFIVPYLMFMISFMPTYNMDYTSLENQFESDLGVGIGIFNFLYIEGGARTYMSKVEDDFTFAPYQSDYYFRIYGEYKGITIGLEHECWHPVVSSSDGIAYQGGFNKIYIKYSSKEGK